MCAKGVKSEPVAYKVLAGGSRPSGGVGEGEIDPIERILLTATYESGSIEIGSNIDTLTLKATSTSKLNTNRNDVYSSKYRYCIELLRADGTAAVIWQNKCEGIDYYNSKVTFSGLGRYYSEGDTTASVRLRIYDDNNSEYVYSEAINITLGAYANQKTVAVGTGNVGDSVHELQAGVSNQTIVYGITATGLTSYSINANTVSVEWCDAQGNAVDNSDKFTSVSRMRTWNNETANGSNYTVYFYVDISNKVALEAGNYYFRVKVNDALSDIVTLDIKQRESGMALFAEYESGSIEIGSNVDTLTLKATSTSKLNTNRNDVYSSKYRYCIELLRADGTAAVIWQNKCEGIDYYNSKVTFSGLGRYYSEGDTTASVRLRIYDDNNSEYVYSEAINITLGAYANQKTVAVGTGNVGDSVHELQAGVSNQTIVYGITATGLTSYSINANTVSVEWCDAQGNAVDNSDKFTSVSRMRTWNNETANGSNYTVYFYVDISNKVALEAGYYYFKVKVNDVESLPVVLTVK